MVPCLGPGAFSHTTSRIELGGHSCRELRLPRPLRLYLSALAPTAISEKTRWPWYSQLPPMSWLVESDVKEARKHLNLSRWDRLDTDEQRLALTAIATVIEDGEMPPSRYVVFHSEAKLSTEASVQVIEWARRERHRLRSSVPFDTS